MAEGLTGFEDGLSTWDVIASVTVEKDDSLESMLDGVVDKSFEHVDIGARIGGEGASEVQVVIGVAEPLKGGEKDSIFGMELGAFDHFGEQHAVGGNGEVVPVLLDCSDGKDDGGVGC
jgi:hypothetical protein